MQVVSKEYYNTDQIKLNRILRSANEFQSFDDYVLTSLVAQGSVPVDIVKKILAESDVSYSLASVKLAIRSCSVLFAEFMQSGRVCQTDLERQKIEDGKRRDEAMEQKQRQIAQKQDISIERARSIYTNTLTKYKNVHGVGQIDYKTAERWCTE